VTAKRLDERRFSNLAENQVITGIYEGKNAHGSKRCSLSAMALEASFSCWIRKHAADAACEDNDESTLNGIAFQDPHPWATMNAKPRSP